MSEQVLNYEVEPEFTRQEQAPEHAQEHAQDLAQNMAPGQEFEQGYGLDKEPAMPLNHDLPVAGDVAVPDAAIDAALDAHREDARPIPRISIQAFCETSASAEALQVAAEDRRLMKAHVSVHMGGLPAATAHYQESPTPNLIILESSTDSAKMLSDLEALAESCDAGTKVLMIGHANDVVLYRELMKRGVSEYLVAPVSPIQIMETISLLYNDPDSDPVGNVMAFVGAKGGVGSSTICHNAGWAISEVFKTDVCIADLDLAFGTTGLDFNQDPVTGIADALSAPERLDVALLDRLMTKCTDHLSIFAAPVMLEKEWDLSADACGMVIDVVRQNVPSVLVDLPHLWTAWMKSILLQADEIIITAVPDLANLRNAKNLVELARQNRKNDNPPKLIINMAKMPKRQEIPVDEFAGHLGMEPIAVIDFDSESFSKASTNGMMIEEFTTKARAAEQFRELAYVLTNKRQELKVEPAQSSGLGPLLSKFKILG